MKFLVLFALPGFLNLKVVLCLFVCMFPVFAPCLSVFLRQKHDGKGYVWTQPRDLLVAGQYHIDFGAHFSAMRH